LLTTVAQKPNQSRKLAGGKRAVIVLRLSKNPDAFFGEAKKKRRHLMTNYQVNLGFKVYFNSTTRYKVYKLR
jgi:hypothetical protein